MILLCSYYRGCYVPDTGSRDAEREAQQKNQHFPLGRAADQVRPECAPGQLGLLTALTRFHGDLAQVMNCRVRPDNAPGQL